MLKNIAKLFCNVLSAEEINQIKKKVTKIFKTKIIIAFIFSFQMKKSQLFIFLSSKNKGKKTLKSC